MTCARRKEVDILRLFRWQARSSGGRVYNGEYYAESEEQVIDFIRRNYGYVTNIERIKNGKSARHWFEPHEQLSSKERANFYKQLATLLDAGIPIVKGIEMITGRLGKKLKPVCKRLTLSLQSGHPLSYAMSLQPGVFPEMNISVIEAGEASGQISRVLMSLSDYYKQQDKLIKLVRNVCIYPGFLLFLAVLTFLFFGVKLVPSFAELYHSLGVKETPLLQILISISDLLQNHAVALSCAFMVGGRLLLLQRSKVLTMLINNLG